MTREEAIKRIQQDLDANGKYLSKEYKEALNMAIEALSTDAEKQVTSKLENVEISTDNADESTMSQPKSKLDIISRADAIKAVEQEYRIDRGYMVDDYTYGFNQAIDYISDIVIVEVPSVSAEPKRGHWVWDKDGMDWGLGAWVCSECGSKPETWWEADHNHNPLRCSGSHYCGNCGAKMEDGE